MNRDRIKIIVIENYWKKSVILNKKNISLKIEVYLMDKIE